MSARLSRGRVLLWVLSVTLVLMASAVGAAPQNEAFAEGAEPFCGCGSKNLLKRGRVVGGEELQRNGAPWLAALARGRKPQCGSALISGVHLLTAAHCIEGVPLQELKAWFGVHSLTAAGLQLAVRSLFRNPRDEEGFGRSISQAWPHPEFDPSTFINDVAVLQLRFPIKITSRLYPICLPANEIEQYSKQMATVTGWGRIGEKKAPSDVPRQASVEVWSDDQCQNSGYPKTKLKGPVLCAGHLGGGIDACQGDSGGPLVLSKPNGDSEVIGVVSWGRGCARPKLPGVYARVASFLQFIKDAMSDSCPNYP